MQQLEPGVILDGKVTGITKFGAFVELPGGKTGMVHISEVTSTYVKEISDHVSLNQTVRVKVLGVNPEGKISLSMKQAVSTPKQQPKSNFLRNDNYDWQAKKGSNMSFEDMMAKFKQTSDDKISDLKKYNEGKHGYSSRKTGGK